MQYTLFNNGTATSFDPTKKVAVPNSRDLKSLLEVNQEFVREANSRAVFIVDNQGNEVQ